MDRRGFAKGMGGHYLSCISPDLVGAFNWFELARIGKATEPLHVNRNDGGEIIFCEFLVIRENGVADRVLEDVLRVKCVCGFETISHFNKHVGQAMTYQLADISTQCDWHMKTSPLSEAS